MSGAKENTCTEPLNGCTSKAPHKMTCCILYDNRPAETQQAPVAARHLAVIPKNGHGEASVLNASPVTHPGARYIGALIPYLEQFVREGMSELLRAPLMGRIPTKQALPFLRMLASLTPSDVPASLWHVVVWARREAGRVSGYQLAPLAKCQPKGVENESHRRGEIQR